MYWMVLAFFCFCALWMPDPLAPLGPSIVQEAGGGKNLVFTSDASTSMCKQKGPYKHWHSINTSLTLDQVSVNIQLSVNWLICIYQHSMVCLWKLVDFRPICNRDVNWVSTNMLIKYWSSFNWWLIEDWSGVDWGLIEGLSWVYTEGIDWEYRSTLEHECL